MTKYRKLPVEIDAMVWSGHRVDSVDYVLAFEDWLANAAPELTCRYKGQKLIIPTLEGDMEASPGDYIIRGIKGEIYPCKPDIFEATYEAVE